MERKYSKRWVDSKTNYEDWDDDDDEYSDEEGQYPSVPPIPHNILLSFSSSEAVVKDVAQNSVQLPTKDLEDEDIYQEEAPELIKGYAALSQKDAPEIKKSDSVATRKFSQPKESILKGQLHSAHNVVENTVSIPKISISSENLEISSANADDVNCFDDTHKDENVLPIAKEDIAKRNFPTYGTIDLSRAHLDTFVDSKNSHAASLNSDHDIEIHPLEHQVDIQKSAIPIHSALYIADQLADLLESSHISKLQDFSDAANTLNKPDKSSDTNFSAQSNIESSTAAPSVSVEKGFQSIYEHYDFDNETDDIDSLNGQHVTETPEILPIALSHAHENTVKEYKLPCDSLEDHLAPDSEINQESFNPYDIAKNHSEKNFDNSKSEILENAKQFSPSLDQGDLSYEESIENSIKDSVNSSPSGYRIDTLGVDETLDFTNVNAQHGDLKSQKCPDIITNTIKGNISDHDSDSFSPLNIKPSNALKSHRVASDPLSIDSKRPTSSHDLEKNFDDLFEDFENLSFGKSNQFTNSNFPTSSENTDVEPLSTDKFVLSMNKISKEKPKLLSTSQFESVDILNNFHESGMNVSKNPGTIPNAVENASIGGIKKTASISTNKTQQFLNNDEMTFSEKQVLEGVAHFSNSKASVGGASLYGSQKLPTASHINDPASYVGVTLSSPDSGTQQMKELRKQSIGSYGAILNDDDTDSDNEFKGSVSMGAWGNKDTNVMDDDKSVTESIEISVDKSDKIINANQTGLSGIDSEGQNVRLALEIQTESSVRNHISDASNVVLNSQANLLSSELTSNIKSNEPYQDEEYSFNESNADTLADVFGSSLHSISDHNSVDFRSLIYRNEFVQKTGAIHDSEEFDSSKINPSALRDVAKYQVSEALSELPRKDMVLPVIGVDEANLSSADLEETPNSSPEIVPGFERSETTNSLDASRNSLRSSRILTRTASGLSRRSSTKSIGISSANRVNLIIEVSSSDEEPDELNVSNGIWGSNAHADSLYKVTEDIEKEFNSLDLNSAVNENIPGETKDESADDKQMHSSSSLLGQKSSKRVSELLSLNTNLNFSDKVSTQDSFATNSLNVPNTPIAKSISEFNNSPSTPTNDQVPPTPKKDAKYDVGSKDFSPAVPPKDNDFTPTKFAPVKHNIPQLLNNSTDQVHDMLRKVRIDEYKHETGLHIWLEATLKSSSLNTNSATQLGPIAKASFDEAAAKKQLHVRTGEPQRRMSLNSKLNVSGRRFLLGTKNVNRNVKEKLEGGFARGLFKRNK